MERNEITEKLKGIVEPYAQDKEVFENLSETTDILKDLKVNSAHLVDIILDTEDTFNIEIDNETAEKIYTVKDVLDIIEQRIAV